MKISKLKLIYGQTVRTTQKAQAIYCKFLMCIIPDVRICQFMYVQFIICKSENKKVENLRTLSLIAKRVLSRCETIINGL